MSQAVITSYARTGMTKSNRGAFNTTPAMTLGAHAIRHAVARAGLDPHQVEDVLLGNVRHGANNPGRMAALMAGLPTSSGGGTVMRFCSSGLAALAMAANHVRVGDAEIVVAAGAEAVSIASDRGMAPANIDPDLIAMHPDIFMPMVETADNVAARYNITRDQQDQFSLESQQRTAAAQAAGLLNDEIVPMTARMRVVDKDSGEESIQEVVVSRDGCNRPATTMETLSKLSPVRGEGHTVTAGNASQVSDGAAALTVMSDTAAARLGLEPLGRFAGWAVVGNEPDEMGIGPVFAIPRLLERHGLTIEDIDLWELNEAFASQAIYCRDFLGIDPQKFNVNGGAIAIGHPFGMTGTRMAGHLLLEGRRRGAKYAVATLCIGGGGGAAALLEVY